MSPTRECRICLSDEDANTMIAPCLCKGSQRWIHRRCLDKWRATKSMKDAFTHCGTCKFKYLVKNAEEITDSSQLWRYRFLVARDSFLFFAVLQIFLSSIALGLQYVFPKGFTESEEIILPEDVHPLVREQLAKDVPEDPGFLYFYIVTLILLLILLGLICIVLKTFTDVLPADIRFPAGCHRGRGPIWHTGGTPGDAAAGIMVIAVVILVIIGVFFAIVIGAYLIERLIRRHYKITWLREETQKYVVTDLSTEEEKEGMGPDETFVQKDSNTDTNSIFDSKDDVRQRPPIFTGQEEDTV